MNYIYYVLYRNGHEDVITQKVSGEEELESLGKLHALIDESFREGSEGSLSLGDGVTNGSFIRISDVIRIRIEVEKEVDE